MNLSRWALGVLMGALTGLLVLAVSGLGAAAQPSGRRWIDLGPGIANAINSSGQIVGTIGAGHNHRAVIWKNRRRTNLGSLRGGLTNCLGEAINDRGQVTGTCGNIKDSVNHAFIWQRGVMRDLGAPNGKKFSTATGINANGDVVGQAFSKGGELHAFMWSAGRWRDLGTLGPKDPFSLARGINNRKHVTGWSTSKDHVERAYVWKNGRMSALAHSVDAQTEASAINNRDEVAGARLLHGLKPVKWVGGAITSLPTLGPNLDGAALGINQKGVVAGWVDKRPTFSDGAMWVGKRLVDLGAFRGISTILRGINNRGDVVGQAQIGTTKSEAVFNPAPQGGLG